MTTQLTRMDLLKVSARLTLIQSAWTSTSMQSEGFVYCLAPSLAKIFPDQTRLKRILKHYQTPINTHPFLVAVLAGAILKMETEGKSTKSILSYIKTTMGPLAALADPFFHGALAPFASVVAALIAFLFGGVAGIVALLLIFNTVHVAVRISGIFIGYRKGETVIEDVGRWIDSSKTRVLRMATGMAGGLLVGLIVYRYAEPSQVLIAIPLVGVICIGISLLLNMKRAAWVYILPAFLLAVLVLEVII